MQGCGYWRVARPFHALRAQYPDFVGEVEMGITEEEAVGCDLVIGQRIAKAACGEWWRQQDPKRLVFELDDDLWSVPHYSLAHAVANADGVLEELESNIRHAGVVTVSTEPLADVIRPINPNVHVLRNYIDEKLLSWDRPRKDRPVVGWAGSATHLGDFQVCAGGLRQFLSKYDWEMHFFGVDYSNLVRRTSRVTMWVDGVDIFHRMIDFDIGLAPLVPNAFNSAKSYIKALEYAALGIPCIASDVGPYSDFVIHGVTGFLVDPKDKHGWFRYLRLLAEDTELRETMGKNAREHAADYTIQGHAHEWWELYEQLLA